MTLAASGTMSIGGSTSTRSINLELGRSATATSSMGESALRTLAGVPSGAISMSNFYGKSNFTPTTSTRTSGSGTETVPSGAVSVRIRAYGGGGSGGSTALSYNGGGGGGGFVESTYSCSGGQTLSYSVGAGGVYTPNPAAGGNSTVTSGTLSITSIDARGGSAGGSGSFYAPGGLGGQAFGGSTNTDGDPGQDSDNGSGGGACLGTGGGGSDAAPGGGGSGGSPGARGEIQFYYT
jgi:hypothetical protein